MSRPLTVRVNEKLVIDAGWWEKVPDRDGGTSRLVHPPAKTMYEQVVEYLTSSVELPSYVPLLIGEEGVAATAVCLRWGSYFAVLANRENKVWSQIGQKGVSRIDDAEMARINIEASAALEQWIELMRQEPDRYRRLVWAAAGRHLPMTLRKAKRDRELLYLFGLTQPEIAARMVSAVRTTSLEGNERFQSACAEAETHPARVLANALINACWRNGPVEELHGGQASSYPLNQRRIRPSEERLLTRTTANRLSQGIFAVSALLQERSERSWSERVLPFNLARASLVTPKGWLLEGKTSSVLLHGDEPG